MFGRYPLSLKRRVLGALCALVFVWGFYGYVATHIYYQLHGTPIADPYETPEPSG